ncbi:hypothetical protein CCACVL1_02963 [Corchorus capsularis]|uniref:Uncharacterized protein n=1 Tax=Corchorus capsularis TaxID=210143 RepID=A0A1R3K4E2_COCAP|nr:hypothetical protein CCACVL1_02963 [Corchorus capsularis]
MTPATSRYAELPHSLPVEVENPLVVNLFSLKPLVELLSSASSVDSPVLVDSLVSGLAALLFSTQKLGGFTGNFGGWGRKSWCGASNALTQCRYTKGHSVARARLFYFSN